MCVCCGERVVLIRVKSVRGFCNEKFFTQKQM
jgi:hypothetical protein